MAATTGQTGIGSITEEAIVARARSVGMRTGTTVTGISGTDIAVITVSIVGATGAAITTIDGAVATSFRSITSLITTVVAGAGDTHILGRACSTAIGLAVVGPTDQARGTLGVGVTITLAFETRTIHMTEVVLTENISGAATASISRLDTDVSKAITILAAKGHPEIITTDQTGGTFVVGIAIALTFDTGTVDMTEAGITMITAHTTTTGAGSNTRISRLLAGITATTGITTMAAATARTGVATIAVETVITGEGVIRVLTSSTVAGIGGTDVTVVTIGIICATTAATARIGGIDRISVTAN
jgi:hypothetical protein